MFLCPMMMSHGVKDKGLSKELFGCLVIWFNPTSE